VLEVFLDRLSWAAARQHDRSEVCLLDDDYADLFRDDDSFALRKLLNELGSVPGDSPARRSPAWSKVEELLQQLGAARPRRQDPPGDDGG
jgi:hypothetical protein